MGAPSLAIAAGPAAPASSTSSASLSTSVLSEWAALEAERKD